MDNLVKEGEQAFGSFDQNQTQNQTPNQGQEQSQQGGGNNQSSSSGGGLGGLGQQTEDAFINQEVDGFATKEGIPGAMDGAINTEVDKEVGQYSKDF